MKRERIDEITREVLDIVRNSHEKNWEWMIRDVLCYRLKDVIDIPEQEALMTDLLKLKLVLALTL